ncbi:MAG: hypothetical protein JXA18_10680 [Chitinispirillaceae bacterium]|nr:hypothetical protein [Chitinispirillaceae bacterium]
MVPHKLAPLFTAGAAALHLFCSRAPVSGPSTEEGNPQIVAVVVDSDRQPVSGIPVTAFRSSALTDSLAVPSGATEVATRFTGDNGRCTFDSLETGTYSLQASDAANSRSAFRSSIRITGDTETDRYSDTLTLDRSGGIRGIVSRGGVGGYVPSQNTNLKDAAIMVIVQEINLSFITPQDGSYSFPELPEGTYTIMYYATDGFFSAKQTVTVEAGSITDADTLILTPVPRLLPPKDFTAVYDTTEAVVTLSWQPLEYDSLRWYEVERIDMGGQHGSIFTTEGTLLTDTISAIPSGTVLNYVIRSVDKAFNKSSNAGPVEIVVE